LGTVEVSPSLRRGVRGGLFRRSRAVYEDLWSAYDGIH
jgi:hypothetical protein